MQPFPASRLQKSHLVSLVVFPVRKMVGSFALILFAITAAVQSNDEHNITQEIQQCLDMAGPLDSSHLEQLPDEDFFEEHCSPTLRKEACYGILLRKYSGHPQYSEYFVDTLETHDMYVDFLHSMCDEDSERKKSYLENLACYNTVLSEMRECVNRTQQLIHDFFESLSDNGEGFYRSCLFYPMLFSCVVDEVATACDEEATNLLKGILDDAYLNIIKIDCPHDDELVEWGARLILFASQQALNRLE